MLPLHLVGRQVLVWRKPIKTSVYAAGFAKHVFWNVLFSKYKMLVSDSQQTHKGRDFWIFIVGDALDKGKKVRLFETNTTEVWDVSSKEELAEKAHTVWGTASWFQRILVVVH